MIKTFAKMLLRGFSVDDYEYEIKTLIMHMTVFVKIVNPL